MHLTSFPKPSPEIDDTISQKLDDTAQSLAVPRQTFQRIQNQFWPNSVAVPLDPDLHAIPPPLPRPKPDLAFGYSARGNEYSGKLVGTKLFNARL